MPGGKVKAWSYSRLTTFERCPKQLSYRAAKAPEVASPAMERGSRIHKDAEEFLLGKHKEVPPTLQGFAKEFKDLRKKKALPEDQIAVDVRWQRVEWFSRDAWLRIVIDARHKVPEKSAEKVIDFKTGNQYSDHLDQLELYALVFFKLVRELQVVEGELWYLDQHDITHDVFEAKEAKQLEAKWQARAKPLLTATQFPATPGRHCRWCSFASARGGPCKEDQ